MSSKPPAAVSRPDGFLDWLARSQLQEMPLVPLSSGKPGEELLKTSARYLECATRDHSQSFQRADSLRAVYDSEVAEYRTLNALGLKVVLTLQWDTERFRILRSLIPDMRYGHDSAMAGQLRTQMPFGTFAKPVDGYEARLGFNRTRNLRNNVLFAGQLVGSPIEHSLTDRGHGAPEDGGWDIDATLDGLSLLQEPFSVSIVATPLPAEYLVGVRDFLLAAASLCSTGAEVSISTSHAETNTTGRSELDPAYRRHRAAAAVGMRAMGMAAGAATLAGIAATIATGGLATPLLVAAGAGLLASSIDVADLFGWKAEVSVSTSVTDTTQTTVQRRDERLGFFAEKLKEVNGLLDRGGQHGVWMWHGSVSAQSTSVARAVADTMCGRLSLMGNSLSPIRTRGVTRPERDAADQAIDHALVPRVAAPVGLLGSGYGALVQSHTLPFLFATPQRSHAGIRVIQHVPVSFSSEVEGERLRVGNRPGDLSRPVELGLRDLTGHLLIAGRTGSGKTVLLRNLLQQQQDTLDPPIPFVFIDLAQSLKQQDWSWVQRALWYESGRSEQLGDPLPSLGLLDFYAPAEYDHYVWQISDLLANWLPSEGPLPMLLAELIHATLEPVLEPGTRFWKAGVPSIPSLQTLEHRIDAVLVSADGGSGRYEGELRSNLRGALITRIKRLTARPMRELLEGDSSQFIQALNERRSLLISLANSGSTNERCFIALLMLMKLRQWLRDTRADAQPGRPRLVIAVDEAHILLRKTADRDRGTQSNIHAYAVRWFDEFMAEIRQLGAAVVILDQSPALLADSVLFSTNNKVVFPLGSGQDTATVAASLSLPEDRARALGTLPSLMGYLKTANRSDLELFSLELPGESR